MLKPFVINAVFCILYGIFILYFAAKRIRDVIIFCNAHDTCDILALVVVRTIWVS